MINLIPHTQKKELERAYTLRVITLYIFVVVCIGLCGLVLLAPVYISSMSKRQVIEAQVAALHSQKNTTKEELNTIISDINSKLEVFTDPEKQFNFSKDVVVPVLAQQNEGISIKTISYSVENAPAAKATPDTVQQSKNIIVAGIAKNRSALLTFENNLKRSSTFTGVNVPISNFVAGSDINFNIQFKLLTQ